MVKYSMKVKSEVHPIVVARGRLLMRNPRAVGYYVRLWVVLPTIRVNSGGDPSRVEIACLFKQAFFDELGSDPNSV